MRNIRMTLVGAGALVTFWAAALPASAWAHAKLVTAVPAAASTVKAAPTEIVLTFNEPITAVTCKLADAMGKEVAGLGMPKSDGAAMHVPLAAHLPDGLYTVSYKVTGDDTHTVSGEMKFTVKAAP